MKIKNGKIDLSEKDFEFVCPVKTADMTAVEKGYFCDKCEKKVYDVSDYTCDEFDVLKASSSGLCINFKKIVTTTILLNSTLCVAVGINTENRLAPLSKITANQAIFLEHKEVVEMGGGAYPVTIFEVDGDIWVPIEPVEVPPSKEDTNSTKGNNCKGII